MGNGTASLRTPVLMNRHMAELPVDGPQKECWNGGIHLTPLSMQVGNNVDMGAGCIPSSPTLE